MDLVKNIKKETIELVEAGQTLKLPNQRELDDVWGVFTTSGEKDMKITVAYKSNSVGIANVKITLYYHLDVDKKYPIVGKTNIDGFVEFKNLREGEWTIVLDMENEAIKGREVEGGSVVTKNIDNGLNYTFFIV